MAFTSEEGMRPWAADGAAYLPSTIVIDILLDARNESHSRVEQDLVDRDLSLIGRRRLMSATEVQAMLDELDLVSSPAPQARRLKRTFDDRR